MRISRIAHSSALTSWERIVANAAPLTPRESTATNSKSSTTLSSEETTRKYSGVRLSPTARMIPQRELYITMPIEPEKMMRI